MEQPRKPVFPVGIGNKGQDTAKYQVSSKGGRLEKLVFQVVKEGQHNNIQKLHVTTMSVQLRKLISQVGLVKKTKEDKKNLWITVGIANSCSSQKNFKKKKETTKTSCTGCDYST